jgi:uncharacterized protein YijF (DUF1287 family)
MRRLFSYILIFVATCGFVCSCQRGNTTPTPHRADAVPEHPIYKSLPENAPPQLKTFIDAAVAQAGVTTGYDPSYVRLDYPGGDVPKETGVCTDVVVRAFGSIGLDLQKEIHEDMSLAFDAYPKKWGLARADSNIDHRRVPNLMTYLARKGKSVSITGNPDDYRPGDIVTWDLGRGVDHIGVVTDMALTPGGDCLVAHNIGAGAKVEDVLFDWKITGHYRYF